MCLNFNKLIFKDIFLIKKQHFIFLIFNFNFIFFIKKKQHKNNNKTIFFRSYYALKKKTHGSTFYTINDF